MKKNSTAQVLKKDGTWVKVKSWKDLERLGYAGEIDATSPIAANGVSGPVGALERSALPETASGGAAFIWVAASLLLLALALGGALCAATIAKRGKVAREQAEAARAARSPEIAENLDDALSPETIDFEDWGAEEDEGASPFDEIDALGEAAKFADETPSAASDAEPVYTEADLAVLRRVAEFGTSASAEADDARRIPNPLRRRTAYVGFEEREVGILLTPAFEQAYSQALVKTPFSFGDYLAGQNVDFNVWGGSFAGKPYLKGDRLPGPSPFILPNATQPCDVFYYDVKLKRNYVDGKKSEYVARKKAEKKKELEAEGKSPTDEEIDVKFPDDKDVVNVKKWESHNAMKAEIRAIAELLDAGKFDEGRKRLDEAQERASYSSLNLRQDPGVKAGFAAYYYYLKMEEIKRALLAGDVAQAEAEFVNLTNSEFFKTQYVDFQFGVYKDFAGLLVKCGRVEESIKYLEYCREYCSYVYYSDRATSQDRRAADRVAASLAWDLIYIYERLGNYEKVVEVGEPLWNAHLQGRSAPARDALFNYDVGEMRKHLAIAYWNVGKKATANEIFEAYLEDRKRKMRTANLSGVWGDPFRYAANGWQDAAARARRMLEAAEAREIETTTSEVEFEFALCRAVARAKSALYWGKRDEAKAALDETRLLLNEEAAFQAHVSQTLSELAAALYAYGCWEDAEFCYRKTWIINAVCFNDPNSMANLDAFLGIVASLHAQGRPSEASELMNAGLEPLLNKFVATRAKTLENRLAASKFFQKTGELSVEAAMNAEIETDEDLEGAFSWGVLGGFMYWGAVQEQRNIEEAARKNTPEHLLMELADECFERKSWARALLLYRYLEAKGGVPGETVDETASLRAKVEARIVECETKLKEETI